MTNARVGLAALLLPLLMSCSGPDQANQSASGSTAAGAAADSRSPRAERVRRIVAEHLGIPLERVVDSAGLLDLGADSLDFIELIMALEDEFSLTISDEEAERLVTVGDLVAAVERRR